MKRREATGQILKSSAEMNEIYQQPVFDEFSIVQLVDKLLYLCWYKGKRRNEYLIKFKQDTARLKKESFSRFSNHYEIGDYEFVSDASGIEAEAFLVIGEGLFLILTNTQFNMSEIAASPLWIKAQASFVGLTERVTQDPVVVSEDDFKKLIPLN